VDVGHAIRRGLFSDRENNLKSSHKWPPGAAVASMILQGESVLAGRFDF
jgi:hypothetical protein